MNNETVVIGPCKCGGYGQVYNEQAEAELGRCHDDKPFLTLKETIDALLYISASDQPEREDGGFDGMTRKVALSALHHIERFRFRRLVVVGE
jgi:hypothetical protein